MSAIKRLLLREERALRAVWMQRHPHDGEPDYYTLITFGEHLDDEGLAATRALLDDPGFP